MKKILSEAGNSRRRTGGTMDPVAETPLSIAVLPGLPVRACRSAGTVLPVILKRLKVRT
jgi:hypothetical protein